MEQNEKNENSNFEVLDTPDKDKITGSQVARFNTQSMIKENLLGFINTTIEKLENENSVKNTILTMMGTELEYAVPGEITLPVLAKTYEIIARADNELALGLFDLIKNNKKDLLDSPKHDEATGIVSDNLNKDDIADIKGILDFVKTAKQNEFNEEEKVWIFSERLI